MNFEKHCSNTWKIAVSSNPLVFEVPDGSAFTAFIYPR